MKATTGERQRISCAAFLPRIGADDDDPAMRRRVVFNAAIEIAELLAKNNRITIVEVSDGRGQGVEYRLLCHVLMGHHDQRKGKPRTRSLPAMGKYVARNRLTSRVENRARLP